jgi:hypothetical protein
MDYQVLFNLAVTVAAFFGGWTLSRIYQAIDRLDSDVRELPARYIAKDDYREDIRDIKAEFREGLAGVNSTLGVIFKKLDKKEDKE